MFVRHLCGCVSWRAKNILPLLIYECKATKHSASSIGMTDEEERKFLTIIKEYLDSHRNEIGARI